MSDPAFGTELQRLRLEAGVSLSELARMVNYSKGYLSKVENSRRPGNLPLARACDRALRADGVLVGIVHRSAAESPDSADAPAVSAPAPPGALWYVTAGTDGGGRLHVPGADPVVMTWPGAGPAEPVDVAGAGALLGTLVEMGRWQAPGVVLPVLAGTLPQLWAMAAAGGTSGTRMAKLVARFTEYAGWMSQERGDDAGALWWTGRAAELAEAAGDRDLVAYTQVRRALVSLYQGDPERTVGLAARVDADGHLAPRVRWLAALREAQGHALGGSLSGFQQAFDRAQRLHLAVVSERDGESPLGSSTALDLNTVTHGWCLYDLGHYDDATAVLDAALGGPDEYVGAQRAGAPVNRSTVRFRLRQALAHAARQDIERSCALVETLLPAIVRLDSATIRTDLAAYGRLIARWRTHPLVDALRPRLNRALARAAAIA